MIDLAAAESIQGWMKPRELRWLALAAAGAQTIVEVGSWKGRSTRALGDHARGVVYAVDTWAGQKDDGTHVNRELAKRGSAAIIDEFRANLSDLIATSRVVPVCAASADAAMLLREMLGGTVDLVFLDGEHGYEGVRADIAAYLPLVRRGGVISGHDFPKPGVNRAVLERFGEVSTEGTIWWARK